MQVRCMGARDAPLHHLFNPNQFSSIPKAEILHVPHGIIDAEPGARE